MLMSSQSTGGSTFDEGLRRRRAFWNREEIDRPVWGISLGFFANEAYPRTMANLRPGRIDPDDIPVEEFLRDSEDRCTIQEEIGDFPPTCAPFPFIPWLEAVAGCPIVASPSSLWAEPCLRDWNHWPSEQPILENPWTRKLLEIMQALVDQSQGRYQISPSLMRGPVDILAAMRGATQIAFDCVDSPEMVPPALERCAEIWRVLAAAQLELIPPSSSGYIAIDLALRTWAPDKLVWLQEDAMALLSPSLYRKFVMPIDDRLSSLFPCVAFHLHGSALWAIDHLVRLPGLNVIELNLEAAACDVKGTFAGWHKIQEHKPLVIWRSYNDDFAAWLDRIAREFSPKGLSIQVSVRDIGQARRVRDEFAKHENHWH
jgi:hypothetical protein